MINEKLSNTAYRIATGTFLTETLNYQEFQETDIEGLQWEPFELWEPKTLEQAICDLAEEIYLALLELSKDTE